MKKTTLLCLLILSGYLCVTAQQSSVINDPNVEKRDIQGFHAIYVEDGIDVYLVQSETEAVAVSAAKPENRKWMVTKVENGMLRVSFEKNVQITIGDRKLKVYVSVKNLDKLSASGGSDVYVQGSLQVPKLELRMSGGGDFTGKVAVTDLQVKQSGGSDVHIEGVATNVNVTASGGGDFAGFELSADYAVVQASGGSDIHVNVKKELGAKATGGSSIRYRGEGVIKYVSSSGESSISKKD